MRETLSTGVRDAVTEIGFGHDAERITALLQQGNTRNVRVALGVLFDFSDDPGGEAFRAGMAATWMSQDCGVEPEYFPK